MQPAFQLANLLMRHSRNICLDRFAISPSEDWADRTRQLRAAATDAIVIVSDDYLQSDGCRREYALLQGRGIPITALIHRDFSTDRLAGIAFDDWIDFRRFFADPSDPSIKTLLAPLPKSPAAPPSSARLNYLRNFIAKLELHLAKMPTAHAAFRGGEQDAPDIRPRGYSASLLHSWEFSGSHETDGQPVTDLLRWAESESRFILRGQAGSGKTVFGWLLALAYAHRALRDAASPLPVWLDLMNWSDAHYSVADYIQSQWSLAANWEGWLADRPSLLIFDNWDDFAARHPGFAIKLTGWLDAHPDLRLMLLATAARSAPPLPTLQMQPMSLPLALKFSSGILPLDQQNAFRRNIRKHRARIASHHVDNLSIGIELLSADKTLAANDWHTSPLPALVALRHQAAKPAIAADALLENLQTLAWQMMQRDSHRFAPRSEIERQGIAAPAINFALHSGLLIELDSQLRFQSEFIQWHLAAPHLKQDDLPQYLRHPQFTAADGRIPQKWDPLLQVIVDAATAENRQQLIEQMAAIDPFFASRCLRHHPALYAAVQEGVMSRLIALSAANPSAQSAFRAALHGFPTPQGTAALLVSQLARCGGETRRWLWDELLAFPLDLPLAFIERVRNIERGSPSALTDALAETLQPLAVAYLVKLIRRQTGQLRLNAIWLLGEIQYLPTAAFLLAELQSAPPADWDEIALALTKYAFADVLAAVLRWTHDSPTERGPATAAALTRQGRLVSAALWRLAGESQLAFSPAMPALLANTSEIDIAIGTAQIAARSIELPELPPPLKQAIAQKTKSAELKDLLTAAIAQLPPPAGLTQLIEAAGQVIQNPPANRLISSEKVQALYAQSRPAPPPPPALSAAPPPALLEQLRGENGQLRHLALNRLVDYPAATALPLLLELSRDPDLPIRLKACEILATYEDEPAAQHAIIAALADADARVVKAAAQLLKSMPAIAAETLLDLLQHPQPATVAAAIDLLTAARCTAAVPQLRALLDDRRPSGTLTIGERAAAALDALDAPAAIPSSASSKSPAPPSPASYSAEQKIQHTLALLRGDDWGQSQKAADFLRRFAKHLSKTKNPNIIRPLCDALSDDGWQVRCAAAEALAWLKNPVAIPYLNDCLYDSNWIVQVTVIRALVELGAKDSASHIAPLLQSPNKSVREAAASALGELRNPDAIPKLSAALKADPDYLVRLAAIQAIQQINPHAARPHLQYALSDRYIHVRWYALKTLAPAMTAADIPTLRRLAHDSGKPAWEEQSIQDFAIRALQRINTPASQAALATLPQSEKRSQP